MKILKQWKYFDYNALLSTLIMTGVPYHLKFKKKINKMQPKQLVKYFKDLKPLKNSRNCPLRHLFIFDVFFFLPILVLHHPKTLMHLIVISNLHYISLKPTTITQVPAFTMDHNVIVWHYHCLNLVLAHYYFWPCSLKPFLRMSFNLSGCSRPPQK